MNRRQFVLGCVAGCSLGDARPSPAQAPKPGAGPEAYRRAVLHDERDMPLSAAGLVAHVLYCFFYPYVSTPCFLVNLDAPIEPTEPAAGDARPGGVGPACSVVAYTAICPHEWSHPDVEFSPLQYVAPGDRAVLAGDRDRLIVCCSHGSTFDPAAGGKVAQSPARLPLASILLEWDRTTDQLSAVGVRGPTSFEPFFKSFAGNRSLVEGPIRAIRLTRFSKVVGRC